MTVTGFFAFIFVIIFFGLMITFLVLGRDQKAIRFREIKAFRQLGLIVGRAVESGTRLHLSIGRGKLNGIQGAVGLVGLNILEQLSRFASVSDKPPVTTTGDPVLSILAQEITSATFKEMGMESQYDPTSSRITGFTPYSYACGAIPVIRDEDSSGNILVGNFGPEVALLTDAGERGNMVTFAGTDDIAGQAVIFATANEPLIGEEVYAAGAYMNASPLHKASVQAQDIARWLLVGIILGGVTLKILGLDDPLVRMLEALL